MPLNLMHLEVCSAEKSKDNQRQATSTDSKPRPRRTTTWSRGATHYRYAINRVPGVPSIVLWLCLTKWTGLSLQEKELCTFILHSGLRINTLVLNFNFGIAFFSLT